MEKQALLFLNFTEYPPYVFHEKVTFSSRVIKFTDVRIFWNFTKASLCFFGLGCTIDNVMGCGSSLGEMVSLEWVGTLVYIFII